MSPSWSWCYSAKVLRVKFLVVFSTGDGADLLGAIQVQNIMSSSHNPHWLLGVTPDAVSCSDDLRVTVHCSSTIMKRFSEENHLDAYLPWEFARSCSLASDNPTRSCVQGSADSKFVAKIVCSCWESEKDEVGVQVSARVWYKFPNCSSLLAWLTFK